MPHRHTPGLVPRMAAQLDSLQDPALIVDEKYVVLAANESFRARYAPDRQVVGRHCYELAHGICRPCSAREHKCPGVAARATGRGHRAVHVHTTPSGDCCADVLARTIDPRDRSHVLLVIRAIDEISPEPGGAKLTGRCRVFCDMVDQMRRVAATDRPVCLVGEPGSGKEFVARTIHAMSGRHNRPFVPVDCTPSAHAELFGVPSRDGVTRVGGLVAAAQSGTLFLDDLEALPPGLQGPVLRLIESGTYAAHGTGEQQPANVRVMCAVERPLAEAVAAGRLRQDLGEAIACSIHVPPLRARREDIPLLVASLLARCGSALPLTVHPRAMALLRRYPFPGNVRELARILEHASLVATGEIILPEHLPPHLVPAPRTHTSRART